MAFLAAGLAGAAGAAGAEGAAGAAGMAGAADAAGAGGAAAGGAADAGAASSAPNYAAKAQELLGGGGDNSQAHAPMVAQVPAVQAPTPFRAQILDHVSNYLAGRLAGMNAMNNSGGQ